MLVVNNEQLYKNNTISSYLPKRIRKIMYFIDWEELEEIRLRQGLPVMLHYRDGVFFIDSRGSAVLSGDNLITATKQDISEALELITHSSLYAHKENICNGFITIPGGNRVGLSGSAVSEMGKLLNLKDISGLNYRIAHEITGCSDKLMDIIMDVNRARSTLIISPPECGKTTLLRDIIRNISNMKLKVSVVDERGEIGSSFEGYPGYDLGYSSDILTGAPKAQGMLMMLRSMSPHVIATDELGTLEDITAVEKIISSGVSVVATIHGRDTTQLKNLPHTAGLLNYFECIIVLSRRFGVGTVEEAYRV